ncbi:TPA: Kae1-associated serine/threonine protein kinase [Candidatus Bathyarchaeota archaeon]|nr:Kae1-associated serine/threonine protein kinase [Candidatus Bathyarchaeota archaeon]
MRLLRKGAEANLYLARFLGLKSIVKLRVKKAYRIPKLDKRIREYRTIHEAALLHEARKAGVPTPLVYFLDRKNCKLILQHVEGVRLKEILDGARRTGKVKGLALKLGELIGKLHSHRIIHGDLTTSNVILTPKGGMVLIDFGLGFYSESLEDRGMDLHLLRQTLESHHTKLAKPFFQTVLEGYGKILGEGKLREVEEKLREIRARGRYIPPEARKT